MELTTSTLQNIDVPAETTLVVVSKDTQIYLEENDKITVTASSASFLQAICSYEEINDEYWNGSLISSNEHPTTLLAASGIYDLTSQQIYKALNQWPPTSTGIVLTDLVLNLDAGETASYPGTGTTWNDLSASTNHGTINGPTYSTANGGVFGFDGNDSVTTSDMFDPNSDFTLNAWVNQDGSTTNTIISRSSGSGALQIRFNNNQFKS